MFHAALAILPFVLLLHSIGVIGPTEGEQQSNGANWFSNGVHWWMDVDANAINALNHFDSLAVAKAYIATVRPTPPPQFCLKPQYICDMQRMNDQFAADREASNPMYWVTHIPQLLWGVPAATLLILSNFYEQGNLAGIVAVIFVLLAGWLLAALFVTNDWLRICLAPFVGSAIAWVLVVAIAIPLLGLAFGVLQFSLTIALSGVGFFTLLDRGHLLMGICEGPLKRPLERLFMHETRSAGLQKEIIP